MIQKYNVLDLFAGCGGLSNGFDKTDKYNIICSNEICDSASDTYENNHIGTKMIRGHL